MIVILSEREREGDPKLIMRTWGVCTKATMQIETSVDNTSKTISNNNIISIDNLSITNSSQKLTC